MIKKCRRIMFIIPPYFQLDEYSDSREVSIKVPVFTIPYGVLSISAYAKKYSKHEIEIEVLDLNLYAYDLISKNQDFSLRAQELIKQKMEKFLPDIVGISALFNTCYNYIELITSSVRNVNDKVLLIIGGGLATNLYKQVLENFPDVDAACYGEGEIPICRLLDAEDVDEYFEKNRSWITRDSLKEKRLPVGSFVNNLDDIPFFDYKLINLKAYSGRSLDKHYAKEGIKELSIHTSRGCPFSCVFCSNGTVHGKKVRYMSVDKVVNEVKQMIDQYGIEVLLIEDDHFLSDKVRAKKILKELSKLNIRIEFPNGIAVYALDEELGLLLKEARVTTVPLAIESGSDYVLKHIINKPLRVSMIKGAVDILRKNGIKVHAFIVVGLPGEIEQHRNETIEMIIRIGFDWVYFFLAIPIAGSRLYEICKENSYLINNDFSRYNTTKCNIRTPEIDPEYMEERAYLMNLEVNFVQNYNVINKNYEKVLPYYKNVVERYPDHALAHYYIAEVYEALNTDKIIIDYHRRMFNELLEKNSIWSRYADYFKLV